MPERPIETRHYSAGTSVEPAGEAIEEW